MTERLTGLLALLTLAALAGLAPPPLAGLEQAVAGRLADSGVSSPVTAVLLNFRGLDTLLEVSVLAAALAGALMLAPAEPSRIAACPSGPLPDWFVLRLAPVLLLLTAWLWWAGSSRPGGAFQAGAMLAGLLLLLGLCGRPGLERPAGRLLGLAGPLLFTALAFATALAGRAFLHYPAGWAGPLIVALEGALTLAIGAALALLANGGRARP